MSLEIVLLLAPAVLLFGALLLGRYPGEAVIERARRAASALPRPRPLPALSGALRRAAGLPRGGRLVGSPIAARPPPCG